MSRFPVISILTLVGIIGSDALAGHRIMIGVPSVTGPVARPQRYLDATNGFGMFRDHFDALPAGHSLLGFNAGAYFIPRPPGGNTFIAVSASAALIGAEVSTDPLAAYISSAGGDQGVLRFELFEPAFSFGFALLDAEELLLIRVFGEQGMLIQNALPPQVSGQRHFVGIAEGAERITAVELWPAVPTSFGIDDVEIGLHTPEPGAFTLMLIASALALARRRGSGPVLKSRIQAGRPGGGVT